MLPFNSPYAEHVRTNYIATATDRPVISHLVSDAQQRLEILEREISILQASFDEKEKQKDILDEEISRYQLILSPIRRLPDEVLSSIFLFCLPESHNAIIDVNEPPLVFGYVSKRWRSLSQRTPLLWASIHIGLINPHEWPPQLTDHYPYLEWGASASSTGLPRFLRCHCEAVDQWLSRAGSSLLSISMDNEPTFRLYFNIIKKFSRNWYKFGCIIYTISDFATLQLLDADALPQLQRVSLKIHCKTEKGDTLGLLHAGNLRFVSIHDSIGDITPELTNWGQITHLTLFDHNAGHNKLHHTLQDIVLVFKYCVKLVQCTLAITEPVNSSLTSDELGQSSQLLLPYLERLSMTDYEGQATPAFNLIVTPSLQSVEYATNRIATETCPSPLVALLSKNGGSVTHLQTNLRHLTYADFTICVASTPQLSSLDVSSSIIFKNRWIFYRPIPVMEQIMKPVFGILSKSSLGFCYWPRLESLSCDTEHTAEDKDILEFVLQRMEYAQSNLDVSPLKVVKMAFNRMRQIDLSEALEQYCSRGLSLDLSYYETLPVRRTRRIFPDSGLSNRLRPPGFPLM